MISVSLWERRFESCRLRIFVVVLNFKKMSSDCREGGESSGIPYEFEAHERGSTTSRYREKLLVLSGLWSPGLQRDGAHVRSTPQKGRKEWKGRESAMAIHGPESK